MGNVDGILHDCTVFRDAHNISDNGIIAVNEVRAVFHELPVLDAWREWHETNDNRLFAILIHEMSKASRIKQYTMMDIDEVTNAFSCDCVPKEV